MIEDAIDPGRRRFLTTAATVVGGAGTLAAAGPFVVSLNPSARTKAIGAPVDVDISELEPGKMLRVKWQGKPVWILYRDKQELESIPQLDSEVRDPKSKYEQQPAYAQNEYRSRKKQFLVVVGICTHLGCSPNYVPEDQAESFGLPPSWKGGFFCPCHGSRFDLAGRVFKGVPAPLNLVVPPYEYLSDTRIRIGSDTGKTS